MQTIQVHRAPAKLVAALIRIQIQQVRQDAGVGPLAAIQEMLLEQRCGEPLAPRIPVSRGLER